MKSSNTILVYSSKYVLVSRTASRTTFYSWIILQIIVEFKFVYFIMFLYFTNFFMTY